MSTRGRFQVFAYDAIFARAQSPRLARVGFFMAGVFALAALALLSALIYRGDLPFAHGTGLFILALLLLLLTSLRLHTYQARRMIARHAAFFKEKRSGRFFYVMATPDPSQDPKDPTAMKALQDALCAYLEGERSAEGPPTIWELAPQAYEGASRGLLRLDVRDHRGKRKIVRIPDAFPGLPEALMKGV